METKGDEILELAIEYKISSAYPNGLSKVKKRLVRKRASRLIAQDGEIFIQRKGRRVKVVTAEDDRQRILRSCHFDSTSGHFGVTKTWKRVAERFFWKGMVDEVRDMVRKSWLFDSLS